MVFKINIAIGRIGWGQRFCNGFGVLDKKLSLLYLKSHKTCCLAACHVHAQTHVKRHIRGKIPATPLPLASVARIDHCHLCSIAPPRPPPHPLLQASALSQYLHTSPFVTTGGQAPFLQRTITITVGTS